MEINEIKAELAGIWTEIRQIVRNQHMMPMDWVEPNEVKRILFNRMNDIQGKINKLDGRITTIESILQKKGWLEERGQDE